MQNDSIEALLLRHYGTAAAAPQQLEDRLQIALRQEVAEMQGKQRVAEQLRARVVTRRRIGAVTMTALGTTGMELLTATLDGLQVLETKLVGQDFSQPAFP